MTVWTYAQLEQFWILNGGSRAMAPLMAAIAEVESGGNDQAVNASGATGLWQIEWPIHAGITACATSQQALKDPNCNARAAVALSGNNPSTAPGSPVYSGWLQWEPAGAYKAYISGSTTPDPNVPGPWSVPGASAADSFFARAAAAGSGDDCALNIGGQHIGIVFGRGPTLPSTCLVRKTEIRAVIGAFILVAGGFVLLPGVIVLAAFAFRASGAQQAAVQTASTLGPSGRVLKAAGRGTAAPAPKPPGPRSPAQGRHAKTGPNAPAQGRHARPGP